MMTEISREFAKLESPENNLGCHGINNIWQTGVQEHLVHRYSEVDERLVFENTTGNVGGSKQFKSQMPKLLA